MKENPYGNLDEGAYRIAYLIAGYIRHTLTEKEHDELDEWITADDKNMLLFEELTDEKNMEANLAWMDQVQSQKSYEALQQAGKFKKPAKRFKLNTVWIAAASIILIAGIYFVLINTGGSKTKPHVILQDVPPGGNKAILTLSDGSTLDLSSAKNGWLKNDHGAMLNKPGDGEISYSANDSAHELFNILSTPKTGQYSITLSDGTKIWLNAESSLRYPLSFNPKQRIVELNGEGYFEVAKDIHRPFKVILPGKSEVKVLGTHFNVMSYTEEAAKEITLLEGIVEITLDNRIQKLLPGEQGIISPGGIKLIQNVDMEEVTGWKNGSFIFHDEEISFIMRQLQRWYGVLVVYKINTSEHFNAAISRNEPLSKILHYLESTGKIHFKIENNTIYVLP